MTKEATTTGVLSASALLRAVESRGGRTGARLAAAREAIAEIDHEMVGASVCAKLCARHDARGKDGLPTASRRLDETYAHALEACRSVRSAREALARAEAELQAIAQACEDAGALPGPEELEEPEDPCVQGAVRDPETGQLLCAAPAAR